MIKRSCEAVVVLVIVCLGASAAQNYSVSVPPGALPLPPYIDRQNFDNSGFDGYGQQPKTEFGVSVYNGSFAQQVEPGGTQTVVYYDTEIPVPTYTGFYAQMVNITACGFSSPHFHPGITELNYVLEGEGLIAGLFLQSDATGSVPTWATGLNKGGVATVTKNSVHYASNPGCGTAVLLQVFAGLPKNYDYLPYIDLPSVLLSQDVEAMQYAYGLTDAQVQNAVNVVRPLFAVNSTCLAICQQQGLVPGPAASRPASG